MALNFEKVKSFTPITSPDGAETYLLKNVHVGKLLKEVNAFSEHMAFSQNSRIMSSMVNNDLSAPVASWTYAIGSLANSKEGLITELNLSDADELKIKQKNVVLDVLRHYKVKSGLLDRKFDEIVAQETLEKNSEFMMVEKDEVTIAAYAYIKSKAQALSFTGITSVKGLAEAIVKAGNAFIKFKDKTNGIQYIKKGDVVMQVGLNLFAKLTLLFPTWQQTMTDTQTNMEVGTSNRKITVGGFTIEEVITPADNAIIIGTKSSFFYPTMPVISATKMHTYGTLETGAQYLRVNEAKSDLIPIAGLIKYGEVDLSLIVS
jgi:hypothetical protein